MPRRQIAAGRCCFECRRRKIKCDRGLPCGYCVKCEIPCAYPDKSRSHQPTGNGDDSWTEAGTGAGATAVRPTTATSPLLAMAAQGETEKTLSSRMGNMEGSLHGLQQQMSEIQSLLARPGALSGHQQQRAAESHPFLSPESHEGEVRRAEVSFPFASVCSVSLAQLHPPAQQIPVIWQMYLDTVDPVLKLFHVPTTQRQVLQASLNLTELDVITECLLFGICYASVAAVSAMECQKHLGGIKEDLLARYRTGVEAALSRADILNSQNLTVLQAFTLFITCNRSDPRGSDSPWLIGLATGIAMRLGMHCEESTSFLPIFEKELRRRLWWQIRTLDVRIAEDYHVEPSILEQACNTALPLNTNDGNLHPDMSVLPKAQQGRTEMLYSLVRFQTSHFARRVVFSKAVCRKNGYDILNMAEKCERIDAFWDELEAGILTSCDKSIPLDFVTVTSTRLVIVKIKLAVCKPMAGEKMDMSMRMSYRLTCEEVLRCALTLRQHEKGQQWIWLFQTYLEWDALAYLLLDLCMTPKAANESTWAVIDQVYEYWKASPDVRRDQRWEHIEELRQEALTRRGQVPGATSIEPSLSSIPDSAVQTDYSHPASSTDGWTPDNAAYLAQLQDVSGIPEWDAALFDHYWQITS